MKKLLICLIALVVVSAAALIGVTVYMNQPEIVAPRAITKSVKQFTEREEIAFAYDTLRQGSINFDIDELCDEDGDDVLEGGSVSGTLYFSDKSFMLKDFYLDFGKAKIDGDVYLSDELLYIEENEILNEAYGASFSELAHDFEQSIFAHDAKSAYSLPENISDIIANYDHETSQAMKKDAKAIAKDLFPELWNAFCENVSLESEIGEVRVGGEKIKARVIRIEITADELANFLEDALFIIEEHPKLNEFIDTYGEELNDLANAYRLNEPDDQNKTSTFREEFEKVLDELEDAVKDFRDEGQKDFEPIVIEMVTPKLSSKLLLLSVDYDGETIFSLDCGKKGMKESDEISLEIYNEKFVYEVEDDDEEFTLSVKNEGEEIFSVDVDKEREEFSISVGDKRDSYILEGTFEKDGASTTLQLEEFTEKYYSSYKGSTTEYKYKTNISITIKQKDKMPSVPTEFKTIDSITEKDVDAWVEKLDNLY